MCVCAQLTPGSLPGAQLLTNEAAEGERGCTGRADGR